MKPYQKTAKDLAFDKERAKLRRQICNLQEALRAAEGKAATKDLVIEDQRETIKSLKAENERLRELTGLSEESLQLILNDAKRTAEAAKHIKTLLSLSDRLGTY